MAMKRITKALKVEKATEITNAKITFVSLVDKAANQRTFLLKKEDGGKATFATYGRIVKTDSENHYVTGIVYSPMTEDSHGDFMSAEEITKAAYYFAKNSGKIDVQHSFEPLDGATVVENWIAKADFKIDDEEIQKGTWLMTVEVTDAEVWDKIEKGEITGFSMGGVGEYSEEDIDLDSLEKSVDEKKGLLTKIGELLGLKVVEKGAMAELYEKRSKGSLFWEAFNSLESMLRRWDYYSDEAQYETDEEKIRECLEDFNKIIIDLLAEKEGIAKAIQSDKPLEKAGKKMSSKNKETLSGIYESLGAFLKEFDDQTEDDPEKEQDGENDNNNSNTEKEEKEVTKQEVTQIVEEAIAKAMGTAAQSGAETSPAAAGTVEKAEGKENTTATEITPESIEKMVAEAIAKAMEPQQEVVTAEQVQEMITEAVAKAVDPVLKSRGLPNNLNGSGDGVEKSAGEQHYLHGIL